jgi:hypothetical protein
MDTTKIPQKGYFCCVHIKAIVATVGVATRSLSSTEEWKRLSLGFGPRHHSRAEYSHHQAVGTPLLVEGIPSGLLRKAL